MNESFHNHLTLIEVKLKETLQNMAFAAQGEPLYTSISNSYFTKNLLMKFLVDTPLTWNVQDNSSSMVCNQL